MAHSYEPSQASRVGPMLFPSNLSLTRSGHILVADVDNSRILSVNSLLDSVQNLALSVDGVIQEPCSFYLDEQTVTSPATAKSKCKSKSKSTLSGQVQVRVQVLFQKAKSKSKSSMETRTIRYSVQIKSQIIDLYLYSNMLGK